MRKGIIAALMLLSLNIFAGADVRNMNKESIHNLMDSIDSIRFVGSKMTDMGFVEVYKSKYVSFTFSYTASGRINMVIIGDETEDKRIEPTAMLQFIHSGTWKKISPNSYYCDGITANYDQEAHTIWCAL